ncbi:hypothetical protein ACKFKG_03165 [Phormidesmis sp. 146-35]
MKLEISNVISILTFLAGAGSAVWGMVRWYGDGEKKRYAAERDFQHLRRNQEQMKEQISHIGKEIDGLSDDFKTLNACFNLLLGQSGQTMSGILGYRKRSEDGNE